MIHCELPVVNSSCGFGSEAGKADVKKSANKTRNSTLMMMLMLDMEASIFVAPLEVVWIFAVTKLLSTNKKKAWKHVEKSRE